MSKRPVYSALDIWTYGHDVLDAVRQVRDAMGNIVEMKQGDHIPFSDDEEEMELQAIREGLTRLDKLLSRQFSLHPNLLPPPDDIPF